MLYTKRIEHSPGVHSVNGNDDKAAMEKEVKDWQSIPWENVRGETQACSDNANSVIDNIYVVENR